MAWFKRSDGLLFAAVEGSASFNLMASDGAFEQVKETAEEVVAEETADEVDKSAAKKPKK